VKGNTVPILIVFIFLLSLVPLVWVGAYARPFIDDYVFSASTSFGHNARWQEQELADRGHYYERSVRYAVQHGNAANLVMAVARTVADNYMDWQGTYTAIALFSLQPAVLFGSGVYPLTMLFTLFALIASTLFLYKTLFEKGWLLPCLLQLMVCIQFVPHTAQGFFWYNGAVYYTFFFSLMLTSVALKIRLHKSNGKHRGVKIAFIALLDLLIGGGNMVTALFYLLANGLCLGAFVYKSVKEKTPAVWRPYGLYASAAGVGLLISVMAPGNRVRAVGGFGGLGHALWSVAESLRLAATDIVAWTTPSVVFFLLASLPFMWRWVRKTAFPFPYPAIVAVLSFLLFASQNAPPLYAEAFIGPPRLRNIVFFSYTWLLFGNAFYLLGWLSRRVKVTFDFPLPKATAAVYAFLALALVTGYPSSSALAAWRDISGGNVRRYMAEYKQRVALLHSPEPVVTLPAFTTPPLTLLAWWNEVPALGSELVPAHTGINNRAMADYYGKERIYGEPPPVLGAGPIPTRLAYGERKMIMDAYLINANRYINLRDLAYFMGDCFDVGYGGQGFTLIPGVPYTPVGGEYRARAMQPAVAYLDGRTIAMEGGERNALRYVIDGEPWYMLRDVLDALGITFEYRYGVIYLVE
jgi:hypothetical protein